MENIVFSLFRIRELENNDFDAICYVLYGEASGEERSDTSMLRSQFADDNVYTSVELTFQLKGKRYEIKRQLGHKNKGIRPLQDMQ